MVFKSFVDSRHYGSSGDLEGHEEPEEKGNHLKAAKEIPDEVVDDFNPTEDGEASEKAHCASYQAQLGFHCHLQMEISIVAVKKLTFSSLSISSYVAVSK